MVKSYDWSNGLEKPDNISVARREFGHGRRGLTRIPSMNSASFSALNLCIKGILSWIRFLSLSHRYWSQQTG
jgi:hypothetical protein